MSVSRLVVVLAALWVLPLHAEDRNCTDPEKATADKLLFLNTKDKAAAVERHLPWGVPKAGGSDTVVLAHWDYVMLYSTTLRVPIWTAHRIEPKGLDTVSGRIECFRQDPRVDSPKATLPGDYDEPDFDQGHLVPSEDLSHRIPENVNSFIMSNMTPQYGPFNRIIWKRLETQARNWAKAYKNVYVISGSIFDSDGDGKPDADGSIKRMKARNGSKRVAIPSHFYKIIVRKCGNGKASTLAFVLPNEKKSHSGSAGAQFLEASRKSIADIEQLTGLEFFRSGEGAKIERTNAHAMWPLKPAAGASAAADCGDT